MFFASYRAHLNISLVLMLIFIPLMSFLSLIRLDVQMTISLQVDYPFLCQGLALSITMGLMRFHIYRTNVVLSLPKLPLMWCDNVGTTCMISNPMSYSQIKEINFHFFQDKVH